MDQVYVPEQGLEPIYNMGLILFRDNIVRYPIIRERLYHTFLEIVKYEQYNNIVYKTTWGDIYKMLIILGMDTRSVYEDDFETPFLQKLIEHYENERQTLLVENGNIFEYIRKISTLLDGISQWTIDCSDQLITERITGKLKNEFITKHADTIITMLEQSTVNMLTSNKYDGLEIIYKHLKHIPNGYSAISNGIINYLHEQARVLFETNEEHNWNVFFQSLVDLKDILNNFLKISTKYDRTLLEKVQCKFKDIMNTNASLVEHLSSLINDQWNKEIKSLNYEQINELFKKIILLYYSNRKDLFEGYYKTIKEQLHIMIPNDVRIESIENILYIKDIFDILLEIASIEDEVSVFLSFLNLYRNYFIFYSRN